MDNNAQKDTFNKEELLKTAEEIKRNGLSSATGRDYAQKAFLVKIAAWLNIIKG